MQIQIEPLWKTFHEVHKLIQGYYADTKAQEGIPPLEMDWSFYLNLEDHKNLVLFTARDGGHLRGVNMYMLFMHPQHTGMLCAACNTLAVATQFRGNGIGASMVEAAEAYFKTQTDVKMIVHHSRTIYDVKSLFPKLGFSLAEHVYMKVL